MVLENWKYYCVNFIGRLTTEKPKVTVYLESGCKVGTCMRIMLFCACYVMLQCLHGSQPYYAPYYAHNAHLVCDQNE